jgi:hypothetical protein
MTAGGEQPGGQAPFRNWDQDRSQWSEEDRKQADEDDARPRVDMTTWTPDQERRLVAELKKAQRYLADNGQDISLEELRRYWGVANAYQPGERNTKIPEPHNFAVHAVFASVPDRARRQELLHSRDDWTEESALEAVRALDRLTAPDAEKRRQGLPPAW